jgi:hypothetical protein
MKIGKLYITGGPNLNFWFVTALLLLCGVKPFLVWIIFWTVFAISFIAWYNLTH